MPRRRSARLAAGALLAAAAPGCVGGHGAVSTDSGQERFVSGDGVATYVAAAKRERAPLLTGTGLADGRPLDVVPGGGPVVVNVWGSWCAPCKSEQPVLERVATATRSRGVRFVGIDVKEPGTTAPRAHVASYRVTYPSFYDPAGRLLTRFKVPARTIPTTYVLDSAGRIAAYVYGELDEPLLTRLVDRVLAE